MREKIPEKRCMFKEKQCMLNEIKCNIPEPQMKKSQRDEMGHLSLSHVLQKTFFLAAYMRV